MTFVKPSTVFQAKRDAIRETASRFAVLNPRIFGSILHGKDTEGSDLDLLVDALPGTTLFDLGGLHTYSTKCYNFSCITKEFSKQKHLIAGQENY